MATAKRPICMLCSDLDHTMVQNEDRAHTRLLAFNHLWTTHCAATPGSLLVFSTGRSPTLFAKLWEEAPLLTPDVLICSVGTEIFYNRASPVAPLLAGEHVHPAASGWAAFAPDPAWESKLDEGWSREAIEQLVIATCPQLKPQAVSEQRPHKISYTLTCGREEGEQLMETLRAALKDKALNAKVIYSGGQDVDILAAGAGKGCGLAFLKKRLQEAGWKLDLTQVNGDSGNDAELLDVPGVVGCVVANAHPELRQYAQALAAKGATHVWQANNPCAGGIVETMAKFGLLPAASPVLQGYAGLLDPRDSSGGYTEPPLDDLCSSGGLLLEEGAREWAWRLGRALAHHLAERSRHSADASGEASLHHSPLRLLVSNACALTIESAVAGEATAAATRASAGGASVDAVLPQDHEVPDPAEIADELQAAGAADAAAADPGGVVRRAWIDQVVVDKVADLSAAPLGSGAVAAAGSEPDSSDASALSKVKLRFKVCSVLPSGARSSETWSVEVEGHRPREPVPHGFLADRISVRGPLPAPARVLGLHHTTA